MTCSQTVPSGPAKPSTMARPSIHRHLAGGSALTAALMLGAALAVTPVTPAHADELSVSTTWALESEYIFRGIQFAETSFQPDISLSYGGFTLGAWASIPVGDDDVAFGDEVDIYGSYETSVTDLVSASVGFTYYMFPDAMSGFFDTLDEEDGTGANTFELFASAGFDVFLSPSATIYYDFMFETVTLEGSAGYSFPITEALSFDVGGTIGHVIDDDDDADYTYASVTGDLAYAFTEDVSGAVGVRYGASSEDFYFGDLDGVPDEGNSVWFGASLSAGF